MYDINSGTGRLVVDDADVYAELKSFFNEYSIPLLWNNQFHYAGASEFDCSKKNLYADQELVCIGKLPSDNRCASVSDLDFSFGDSLLADDNMLNVSFRIQAPHVPITCLKIMSYLRKILVKSLMMLVVHRMATFLLNTIQMI